MLLENPTVRFKRMTALITLAAFISVSADVFAHDPELGFEPAAEPVEFDSAEVDGDFQERIERMRQWLEQRNLERQRSGEYVPDLADEADDYGREGRPRFGNHGRGFRAQRAGKHHKARSAGKARKHGRNPQRSARRGSGQKYAHSAHSTPRHRPVAAKAAGRPAAAPKKAPRSGKSAKPAQRKPAAQRRR
jgi:hypothetical protein